MKVLHSIPSINPSFGGPVAVMRGLCGGLNKLGVKQAILTSSTGNPTRDQSNALAFPNIEIIWVKPLVRRYYWSPFLNIRIRQKLKEFDICHVHGVFNGISRAVCKTARALDIPYILGPFGTLSPYCLAKSGFIKKLCLVFGERRNIDYAAGMQFSSEGEFHKFKIYFRTSNGFIARNGLDWREFYKLPEPGKFRADFHIGKEELIFLFLGRLQPIKGLEVFIPAFLQWTKSRKIRVRLAIAGPDEAGYQKKLEQLLVAQDAAEVIFFTGALYGQDRIQAMVDSDVVVLPSFHESFGISAAEGMACSKPILISDQVGIWPDVKRFDLGEIASMNVESMIAALDRILMRKSEWDTIGQRGRVWAEEKCDWNIISETILLEYTQLIF